MNDNPLKRQCKVPERSANPLIKVRDIAYLAVDRPNLTITEDFLIDFGMARSEKVAGVLYMRGTGTAHHIYRAHQGKKVRYRGAGFYAQDKGDLEKLSRITGASAVETVQGPEGGYRVTLTDPDGIQIEVCYGMKTLEPLPMQPPIKMNYAVEKVRYNDTQRPPCQPAQILRLGHTVLGARRAAKTIRWYQDTLGFIVSDFQLLPGDPIPVIAFMRCDRGSEPADHHTVAIVSALHLGHIHSAFEVQDLDAIGAGSRWLERKKRKHSWGIGRHILGSQIFDYWRDSYGDMYEHFADGDLFDNTVPAGYHLMKHDSEHQWGPGPSLDFLDMKPSVRMVLTFLKRILSNDDFTLKRMQAMMAAIAG